LLHEQTRSGARRLTNEEGAQLQRIVRRGGGKTDKSIVKWRRAPGVLASTWRSRGFRNSTPDQMVSGAGMT